MAGPFRTPQKYTFHTELRGARGVITNLNAIARALDVTRLASTKTFQIDKQIRTLTTEMGGMADEADRLAQASLGLASATGASSDNTGKLIAAYQRTGRVMGGFNKTIDKTTNVFSDMTAAQHRSLRAQANLVDLFGMSAAEVVELTSRVHHLGLSMDDMLGATAKFQKKFEIPGMMKQMGKLTLYAESAMLKFSRAVTGDADRLIVTAMKVGTVYSKAYGVDIAKGIDMARKQQERFMTQAQKDADVFLGLSDTFDGLTMALFEAGLQMEEVNQLTALGQKDPIAYAQSIKSIYDSLGGEGDIRADRFMRQMQERADETTKRLLMVPGALAAAQKEKDALADFNKNIKIDGAGLASFEDLSDSLRTIGAHALQMIKNLTEMFKTIVGTAFAKTLSKAFQGAIPVLKRFNDAISELTQKVVNSPLWTKLEPYLVGLGKVLVGVGAAAGVLATAFASTIIPAKLLIGAIRVIPVIGNPVAGSINNLGSTIFNFAKDTFHGVAAITGIGVALNDFGEALKDESITKRPMVLFLRSVQALSLGIVETFDGILGGIPTWIAKQFFPEMIGTLGDNTRLMFQKLQLWFELGTRTSVAGWGLTLKNEINGLLGQVNNWFDSNWNTLSQNATLWGENIGRAIGTLADWAWSFIQRLFDPAEWSKGWDTVVGYFTGKGGTDFETGIAGVLQRTLALVGKFTVALVDGILEPWGLGWVEAKNKFLDFYDRIRVGFHWMSNIGLPLLKNKWTEFKLAFVETALAIKDGVHFAFDSAKGYLWVFVGTLMKVWDKVQDIWLKIQHKLAEAELGARKASSPAYWAATAGNFARERDAAQDLRREMFLRSGNMPSLEWALDRVRTGANYRTFRAEQQARLEAVSPEIGAAFKQVRDTQAAVAAGVTASTIEDMQGNLITGQQFVSQGQGVIDTAKGNWNTNRAASATWMTENMGDEQAAVRRHGSFQGRMGRRAAALRQQNFERRLREDQNSRYAEQPGLVGARESARRETREARRSDFERLNAIRLPYADRLRGILEDLDRQRRDPRVTAANKGAIDRLYQNIERRYGQVGQATSEAQARGLWQGAIDMLRTSSPEFIQRMSGQQGREFDPTSGALPEKPGPAPGDAGGGPGVGGGTGGAGGGGGGDIGMVPPAARAVTAVARWVGDAQSDFETMARNSIQIEVNDSGLVA